MTQPRFICIVPAYNEARRIGSVLKAAVGHPLLSEVIVIDDGSSDDTAAVAAAAGARVLAMGANGGKTMALSKGLEQVDSSHVVLLDADLEGLTSADITALIAPVQRGHCDASISLRGNAPLLWRWLGVDYISGERVIPLALIRPHVAGFKTLPRFGFEVFLNGLMQALNLKVAIVRWPRVASPSKRVKRGSLRGPVEDARMMLDIVRTVSLRRILSQILYLKQIDVQHNLLRPVADSTDTNRMSKESFDI